MGIVAGHKILAAEVLAAIDAIDLTEAWTSYTPTWSSTGTNPAVGNGSISGHFVLKGKLAIVQAVLVMGSTTTYGTGTWRISLPTEFVSGANYQAGALYMIDNGTAEKCGCVYTHTDTDKVALVGATAAVSATSPHTWANTDYLSFWLTMETA